MALLDPGMSVTLRPMKYPQFHEQFRTAYEKNNWTLQEISFSTDKADLREKLTDAEKHVINRLCSFFSFSDQIVAQNSITSLYKHVNSAEARLYYGRQIFEESLHVDFYMTLLDEYITDPEERAAAFASVVNIPSIKAKDEFARKWMNQMDDIDLLDTQDKKRTFLMNMIAFACAIEGMFFFAAFAYVYYLRDRGLLHGLGAGTNWVFRDESAHMRFAFSVIDVIRKEEPDLWDDSMDDRVREMLNEAIACEMQFADDALSLGVLGLSKTDMHEYLRYVADGHCHRLGIEPMFNAKCPFEFMLKQDVMALTSFFERTVSEYAVGVGGDVDLGSDDF